jgi:hypothetical protein
MMKRKVRVYVASAYTVGNQVANVRRNILLCKKLWDMGYIPYCPLLTHFQDFITPMPYEEWLEFDKYALDTCHCLLWDTSYCPGESKGAEQEVAYMRLLNRPVFRHVQDLSHVLPPAYPFGEFVDGVCLALPEIKL